MGLFQVFLFLVLATTCLALVCYDCKAKDCENETKANTKSCPDGKTCMIKWNFLGDIIRGCGDKAAEKTYFSDYPKGGGAYAASSYFYYYCASDKCNNKEIYVPTLKDGEVLKGATTISCDTPDGIKPCQKDEACQWTFDSSTPDKVARTCTTDAKAKADLNSEGKIVAADFSTDKITITFYCNTNGCNSGKFEPHKLNVKEETIEKPGDEKGNGTKPGPEPAQNGGMMTHASIFTVFCFVVSMFI